MRKLIQVVVAAICMLTACSKSQDSTITDGHYSGTFRRVSAGVGDTAYVAINFTGNRYEGEVKSSPKQYYPVPCKGTYGIDGSTIKFANECFFTANFDWSYILGGDYQMSRNGDSLTLIRDYNGIFRDEYRLLRLKR